MSDFLDLVNALLRANSEPFVPPYYPPIDRRDNPAISVGGANILPFPALPRVELPDLGADAETPPLYAEVDGVMPELDWRDSPFALPGVTEAGVRYMERQAAAAGPPPVPIPLMGPLPAPGANVTPSRQLHTGDTNMSFWDDLGDIATDIIRAEFGPNNPPYNQPTSLPVETVGGQMLPPDLPPGGTTCSPNGGPFPVLKMVCGQYKWVYPKRKRRRALLTESDYNALLRVQNLKVNQNMTVAIAKALTR